MTTRTHSPLRITALLLALAAPLVAGATTTSTSTSLAGTSTTTSTLPAGCDAVVPGTLAALQCRLTALVAEIDGTAGLGSYQGKLSQTLKRVVPLADEAATACSAGDTRTAGRRMKQVQTLLEHMSHRLHGLSARKRLESLLRAGIIQAIDEVHTDAGALRKHPCS